MTYENTVDYQDLHWRQIRHYCATFAINERQFKISKKCNKNTKQDLPKRSQEVPSVIDLEKHFTFFVGGNMQV